MALIRGNKCLFPCPVCLVPASELSNLAVKWPRRTVEQAKEALNHRLVGERQEATKELGLRPIEVQCSFIFYHFADTKFKQNSLWQLQRSNLHDAASEDGLHFNQIGIFGYHLYGQFKLALSKRFQAMQFDERYQPLICSSNLY